MRALAAVVVAAALAACHHAPPPKPPAAERPLAGPGDLAGDWVMSDDMDFGYHLSFAAGTMTQTMERARLGKCKQVATLAAGSEPRTFAVAYSKDECDEGGPGAKRTLQVVSYTADALDVIIGGGVAPLHRRYTPAPTTTGPAAM